MKKRFALFLSLVLSIGAALPAFAASNVELDEDTWEQISDVLQPDNYGGMYYGDDGQLHIKPIADADVETMLFDNVSSRASRNIVIDEVAQYSVEELDEASMVLEEYMDEYGITYIALDNKNNGLAIGVTELSQETEDALRELSPVENVSFDLLETEEVAEIQETAVEEETRASAGNLARSGSTIYNTDSFNGSSHERSTLGVCVQWTSRAGDTLYGYVTTGHKNNLDDKFTISLPLPHSITDLGIVADINFRKDGTGSTDMALISNFGDAQPTDETIVKIGSTEVRRKIVTTGDAVDGMDVTFVNNETAPAKSTVEYAWATINFEDGVYSYKMRHMMVIEPIYSGTRTDEGDSGCAIVTNYGSNYKLLGIYKGRIYFDRSDVVKNIVGTNWGNIYGNFDLPSGLEIYR